MACKCDVGLGNTGLPNCQPIASVAKKLIIVPTFNDAGAKNGILLSDTLDQAYFDAKVNEADASARWFPLPSMENITNERADSILETAGSGKLAFIREGVKSFFGEMWKQSPAFLGKLKEARCTDISIFIIDNDGNLIGSCPDEDGYIYPIQVDKESWDAKLVDSTDTTVQKVSLGFNWSDDEKDEDIRMITSDDYTGNLLALKGLLDVCVEAVSVGTTQAVVKITTIYGSKASPVAIKGLLVGDLVLTNNTTQLPVVIATLTEAPAGTYTLDYAAQTIADELSLGGSKAGLDFTKAETTVLTVA